LEYEKKTKAPKKKPDQPATPKPPVFTKKENSTLEQRIEVLDWYHKNSQNQSATAWHFAPIYPNLKLKQPLVSTWVKEEAKLHEQWTQVNHKCSHTSKQVRQTEHPEVTEMMDLWVSKAMGNEILLTGEVLHQKLNTFAKLVGIPKEDQLKLSNGWLGSFKNRHGLKEMKRHGEAASSSAEKERKRIQELIIKYGYRLCDIFNMDETGLFYGYAPIPSFPTLY
jgi:Tc5 transposase DNA-binding domain/Helix-turn-helix domain (DUF4817)